MKKSQWTPRRTYAAAALVILAYAGTPVTVQAAYILNATEVAGDVVFEGSGSIDLTATTYNSTNTGFIGVQADDIVGAGPTASRDLYVFSSLAGPATIGPGTALTFSSAGTGDYTLFDWTSFIAVPAGYTSKDSLTGTSTYDGQTFASLGLAAGTYDWTWGSGATADSFTLNVGAVPIPAAVWLFGSGLLGLVAMARRKKAA